MNIYNKFCSLSTLLLLHLSIFITNSISLLQTTLSNPVDHEYYVQEEVTIGTLIGNLMNDVVIKYVELGLVKISHRHDRPVEDSNEQYTFKIVNFADPFVNLFDVKLDGRLMVNRRLDRDQICPKQQQLGSSIVAVESTQTASSAYTSSFQQTTTQTESISCFIILQVGLFIDRRITSVNKADAESSDKMHNRLFHIGINVQDINDNAPYWQGHLQRLRITFLDGDPAGSRRTIPPALDIDAGINGQVTYELSPANPFDKSNIPFSLLEDSTDGLHLYATKPIDREEQSEYKLVLQAIDGSYASSSPPNESILRRFTSTLYLDVFIEDVNDNTPQFTQPIFATTMPIPETTPVGTTVLLLNATDLDSGVNGIYHFGFSKDHYWQPNEKIARHYFDIRPNGQIIVRQALNVDKLDRFTSHTNNNINSNNNNIPLSNPRTYHHPSDDISMQTNKGVALQFRFRAIVEDEASRPYTRSSEATVIILVTDENDESPIITVRHNPGSINSNALDSAAMPNPFSYFNVFENQPVGTVVASVRAYDPDFGGQDQVECSLKDANFSLIRLMTKNQPDYDQSNGMNSVTEYQLVTARILDREITTHQMVTVLCSDMVGHYTERNITVHVVDENDNPPKFSHDVFYLQVDENAPIGTQVRRQPQRNNRGHFNIIHQSGSSQLLPATDFDIGINSEMVFFLLEDGINSTRFKIDSHTGAITTMDIFDREAKDKYMLSAIVVDRGTPQLTGSASVQIIVNDLNDNGPVFSQNDYTFHIQENQPRSSTVGHVSATDLDSSVYGPLEYSFTDDQESANFTIDKITGIIRIRQSLDREEKSQYVFRVLVKDTSTRSTEKGNGIGIGSNNGINSTLSSINTQYTGTSTITVIVDDVNDNWPVFISPNSTASTLAIAIDQTITGYKLAYIQAYDKDDGDNGLISYNILAGNNYGLFGLDSTSGLLYLSNPVTQKNSNNANESYNSLSDSSLDERLDVLNLLQKSSMHILTLEACDHGKDPKPRCTLYNNLKIIIQNNKGNDIHSLENKQSQSSLLNHIISFPNILAASSSMASPTSAAQTHHDKIQSDLTSLQGIKDNSFYRKPTALPYGNLLSNTQNYKVLNYSTNDIMIISLSLIFALVLVATLVLVCLVRRRVTWFKNQDKKAVKNDSVSQWGNQTVCQNSLLTNQNLSSFESNKLISSLSENPLNIRDNTEFSKSTISSNNNNNGNNYDANFIGIQNSLHKSILLSDESGSPRSTYQYLTSFSPTQVTQTQITMPITTPIDYKQYGCNTHEVNNKFHQSKTSKAQNNHDVFNGPTVFQKLNEHTMSLNKFDDYQTLDYLGLVSPMMINKQPVYHKNLGLVTYSPRVLNMPILLSNTSNGRSKFSYHQQHHYDPGRGGTRQSLSSIHYSPNPENTSYQIAHFHSLSQPQSMNSRYTTLPTFSNCSQTVNEINSAFVSDYNQYPNIVTTQNNNSSNDKIGNILLPYQLMATSIINLNSWSYNNRVAKHPTQSNTYYDIRQPDFESNKTTMSKSKSQQLSTNNNFTTIETYLPNNDINEDDCLIESSTTWNDTKTISQTTESINESNNNNNLGSDIGVTHLSKSWNETKKWTTDNITNLPKNLVKVSDQNFQSHNNINNFITIAPTISTATLNSNTTTTNITDKTTVTVPHTNNSVNSSNIVSVIHSSQIGKQKKVNDSGKYMSAALRESSFV